MVDPTTVNKLLAVPTRGSDSGTWDTPVNGDFTAIDGMLGGVTTVSLTNANVSLTAPTGSVAAGAGPFQQQNAVIKFSGTLTGNCTITFTLPGFYIVENNCTVGAFYVLLSGGSGNKICAPPGRACHVYTDGTDMNYVNMPDVGSYMDLSVSTVPAWISNCTIPPWLRCDGTVYTVSTLYGSKTPALFNLLGATYGGNGSTTFAVPDLGNRWRVPVGGGRITVAGGNFDGSTLGSGQTDQSTTLTGDNLPELVVTDTHTHATAGSSTFGGSSQASNFQTGGVQNAPVNATNLTGINTSGTNTGAIRVNVGGNSTPVSRVPPALVACMTFIKT
jgi:microcystin-dependent protein